jgi:hypothetical protein
LARAHHQELATGKLTGVFLQHGPEVFDLGLQGRTWQPEEEDAAVGDALVENQLAEVAVGNDQDPLLPPGGRKHVLWPMADIGARCGSVALIQLKETERAPSSRLPHNSEL